MASTGGVDRFLAIPGGGAGRGPIWGQWGRGVLTGEPVHGSALGRWGLGSGRPEEQLVAAPEGSGSCTVLARRSLRWRRSASVAEGGARRGGGLDR
jgi:hypothetical protein